MIRRVLNLIGMTSGARAGRVRVRAPASACGCASQNMTSEPRSSFVSDLPQQVPPPFAVGVSFDPDRRGAVDDAHDPTALSTLGDDDLERVRGRAEDAAHLG